MPDIVPPHLMNEGRLGWARGLSLGQARAYDALPEPERDLAAEELVAAGIVAPIPDTIPSAITPLAGLSPRPSVPVAPQIVGQVITGRQWIVCQLPDGRVRASLDEERTAWAEAERLATDESGEFAVFQPRGMARPQTTVTKELL